MSHRARRSGTQNAGSMRIGLLAAASSAPLRPAYTMRNGLPASSSDSLPASRMAVVWNVVPAGGERRGGRALGRRWGATSRSWLSDATLSGPAHASALGRHARARLTEGCQLAVELPWRGRAGPDARRPAHKRLNGPVAVAPLPGEPPLAGCGLPEQRVVRAVPRRVGGAVVPSVRLVDPHLTPVAHGEKPLLAVHVGGRRGPGGGVDRHPQVPRRQVLPLNRQRDGVLHRAAEGLGADAGRGRRGHLRGPGHALQRPLAEVCGRGGGRKGPGAGGRERRRSVGRVPAAEAATRGAAPVAVPRRRGASEEIQTKAGAYCHDPCPPAPRLRAPPPRPAAAPAVPHRRGAS